MKQKVVAIGLDSADPDYIRSLMDQGELPNLAKIREQGTFRNLDNTAQFESQTFPYSSTEGSWVSFQTGVRPARSGYWETFVFDKDKYVSQSDQKHGGYGYEQFSPFYALGDEYKVAVFDLPVSAVLPNVNGVQLVGWGGHWPFVNPGSEPAPLLNEVNKTYGRNKVLYQDYGEFWNPKYLEWLEKTSIESIQQRTRICLDLLERDEWDLFLAAYGETHGAAHDLWFASQPDHPLHQVWNKDYDPLLKVFQAIDGSLGAIHSKIGPAADFLVYSVHGIQSNVTDLGSFFFLPEAMYRFQFPGRSAFAQGDPESPVEPPIETGKHNHWFGEIWRRKTVHNRPLVKFLQKWLPAWFVLRDYGDKLLFPYFLDWSGPQTGWLPSVWFQPAWPEMRSFALPSFSDGHIRINVAGREQQGIVSPSEYEVELERVESFLKELVNPRNQRPIVKQLVRTRTDPLDKSENLPDADLIVVWDDIPFDVVDGETIGRIGPVPYHRTGGHREKGFFMGSGPQISSGTTGPVIESIDIAPSILDLIGAKVPDHFDGESIFSAKSKSKKAA